MPSLVALSVGPIQEFIAAARRTRDLFAGSKLLSELSKAAAKGLSDARGITIFRKAKFQMCSNYMVHGYP